MTAGGYREPARTYRSVVWTALAVAVLFCFDLLIGGVDSAVSHLPGWAVVAVVLLGVHVLLLRGVRATHSLTVTDDAVRVGEDAVPRAAVRDVRVGVVDPELPALGWRTGLPRGSRAVSVTLADGRELLVPTRDPERLRTVLAGAAAEDTPVPERPTAPVRDADADDEALLPDIDARAETLFRVAGYDLSAVTTAAPPQPQATFVVQRPPVGYAVVAAVDGEAYLAELAVLPGEMRRGLGTALLEHACAWALDAGYTTITLTTFANVPWNAPFYAARGFAELVLPGPELAALREKEIARGLDAVGPRLVMSRALSRTTPASAPPV